MGRAVPHPVLAISTAVLPTGKVLMFAYPKNPSAGAPAAQTPNTSVAYLWDRQRGACGAWTRRSTRARG